MGTRTMHSYETKMKVIEMKLAGYSSRFIQTELGIKNCNTSQNMVEMVSKW
ncbi:ISErh1 transposase orfA [Erysipelothrix rhusiopathiae SY1027]|nr:ISErh1 transposase orfA [Erysipelothrix rhusiopathiae SY1027]